MTRPNATLEWYLSESRNRGVPPRCPFASPDRCPRFYHSLDILARAGKISPLDAHAAGRLEVRWKDEVPIVVEDSPGYASSDRGVRWISHICPEVGFDTFGHFSTGFYEYADEIDAELAHKRLGELGADREDFRWYWSGIHPQHYTECRQYSVLTGLPKLAETLHGQRAGLVGFLEREKEKRGLFWVVVATLTGLALGALALL